VLYFFLQFIPNLGSILALVPPTLLALVTLGWERALVVAVGMLLTNLITANVLNPIFLKKGVDISFLEIILSLIVWGSLLGSTGSLVAIPLTIVLKKYFENSSVETETLVAG
jgi:predicted PurR-regulated permease PerM